MVPLETLHKAGLRNFEGLRETLGGQEMVSLKSLAPGVTFSVDDIDLRLTLTTSPELLGLTVRDLWSGRPANLVYRKDTSSYVNYSANWHSNRQFDLFAESATSVRGVSLYNSVAAHRQSVTRGLTSVTLDQQHQMRRWTVATASRSADRWAVMPGSAVSASPRNLPSIRITSGIPLCRFPRRLPCPR
jgi:hypothetical protein